MGANASKPTDPSVTPKVIAAGYSRTGTASMAAALEKLLDGPVLHASSALYGREDAYALHWYRILQYRNTSREKLLKLLKEATTGYVAVTDSPAVLFVPELLELYPDAKVVLADRDTDAWWESMQPLTTLPNWALKLLLWPCFTWRWIPYWLPPLGDLIKEKHGADVGQDLKDKHNASVRALVPRKSLLEMRPSDGWAPLAAFLKKPVPSGPFPQLNDDEAMNEAARNILNMALLTWAMYIVGYGSGIVAILWWLWSSGRL